MAKMRVSADFLMEMLMQRRNFVTINSVSMDPVSRTVTFEITGADVPDAESVSIQLTTVVSHLVPIQDQP